MNAIKYINAERKVLVVTRVNTGDDSDFESNKEND